MAQFWGILGPNSSKYCLISIKFLPEVVLKDKKTLFGDSFGKPEFLPKREIPKVCTLSPIYPLKMAEIEENKNNFKNKIQSSGYPNMSTSTP